ncbi:MAG: YdbL family protein [Candidatus Andeanibacterium colombiense]|uniref:YdbL family protein n=1 Tax=Candidatus Andeanibacterium colombiense TaxID=3121345 RepID=A0AAJ5XAR1_9SPHN|nr:MAG: YdbL family protein [Sphingomonadaceae bacterium]
MIRFKSNTVLKAAAALAVLGLVAAPALAQRDPAYQAARTAGEVGEKMDGYLGIVAGATPALTKMVNDINIQRKAVYTKGASASGVTVEDFAFGSGCKNIRDTAVGEKYQAPGGAWQTRTSAPPQRDSRCP